LFCRKQKQNSGHLTKNIQTEKYINTFKLINIIFFAYIFNKFAPENYAMRKKLLLSLFISSITVFSLTAQTRIKITGQVKDVNGKALSSATVMLFNSPDSTLIKTELTDVKGKYEIEVSRTGNYYITASSSGYEKKSSALFSVGKYKNNIAAPPILLALANKYMDDVTVTGSYAKPMIEVTAGKTVFNVENSINATGSNAFELLQKSPGVVTDKDDNIIIKGKNGVRIYIDGRPTEMSSDDLPNYLRSINSADIESIEIISNPSAQYDASGNAGIVNISFPGVELWQKF
jgi:iron complex outermembrane receptor protein